MSALRHGERLNFGAVGVSSGNRKPGAIPRLRIPLAGDSADEERLTRLDVLFAEAIP